MAVIIFKALESCNANCAYCEVIKKNVKEVMDTDILETAFMKIGEYLRTFPKEDITFTWHGGEVALLGADYFNTAYEIQQRHCKGVSHRIKHQVQSNLTIINRRLIDAFKKMGINHIGSSYELVPGIRGLGPGRNSDAYNRRFMKGVELLKENDMNFGIIYVVNRRTLLEPPLKVFNFLNNLNLRSGPNINKIYIYGEDTLNLNITQEEFADFLGAIFPYWYKHQGVFTNFTPFSQLYKKITGQSHGLVCERSGACAYKWLYIGPTGNLSHCGRAGDFEGDFFDYGNIVDDAGLYDIFHHKTRGLFVERQRFLIDNDCSKCRFWGVCHGGCLLDAFAESNGNVMTVSPHCISTKRFLERYFEPVTGIRIDMSPGKMDFQAIEDLE